MSQANFESKRLFFYLIYYKELTQTLSAEALRRQRDTEKHRVTQRVIQL
jgi:hypothetical protein